MNKLQISINTLLIVLFLSIAILGIVDEAQTHGKTNGMAFGFFIVPSFIILSGLISNLVWMNKKFYSRFFRGLTVSLIVNYLIFFLGQFRYHPHRIQAEYWFNEDISLFAFIYFWFIDPLGYILVFGIVNFLLLGIVHLLGSKKSIM